MSFVARLMAIALFSAPAFAGTVRLTTADRISLSADYSGAGKHGVVLVHGHGEDRSAVVELSKALVNAKMQVISIDLRGHGASKGTLNPSKSVADIAAAVSYLRKRGAERITLVGAELGANLALNAAAQDKSIADVVMISPALKRHEVRASTGLAGYGDRPILMVVGGADPLGLKAANMLDDRMSMATIEVIEEHGVGSKLIKRDPDLPGFIVEWVAAADKRDGSQKPDLATENEGLKTSGTKLGER